MEKLFKKGDLGTYEEVYLDEEMDFDDFSDAKNFNSDFYIYGADGKEIADMNGLSLKAYDVRESNMPCRADTGLTISNDKLENEKYIVKLNANGDIESIFDKKINKELLKEPIVTGLFNYNGSEEWPAWEMNYDEANKAPDRIPQLVSKKIIENGPARIAIEIIQKDDRSTFKSIISLTNDGQIVSVNNEIEWQSLRTMAKNIFSLTAKPSPISRNWVSNFLFFCSCVIGWLY